MILQILILTLIVCAVGVSLSLPDIVFPGEVESERLSPNPGNYNQNQGNYNQNQGNYNQNQGNYNQNQGSYNQNPGNYHQNQGIYNQNQGNYNQNQGNYNQNQQPGNSNHYLLHFSQVIFIFLSFVQDQLVQVVQEGVRAR